MSANHFQTVISRTEAKTISAYEALTDKDAPIDVLSGPVSVADLTIAERKGLINGPKADVYIGNKLVFRNASIRALMAWSHTLNAHFYANPLARTVTIDKSCDVTAIEIILKATITTTGMGGEKVAIVRKGENMEQLIRIYQAGLALGMDERVAYHRRYLKHFISEDLISYQALDWIVKYVPSSDVVFKHLAQDLAYRRHKHTIPDAEEFEAWLKKHVELKDAMAEADAPHKAVRKANNIAKDKEVKRQQMAEQRRQHKAEQKRQDAEQKRQEIEDARLEAEYWSRVAALKNKINAARGGILSLTQEEAELRRELAI